MEKPLTSIVIPAYNAERFLERTLHSAMQQTYATLEIIIVNDGSTDTTRLISEEAAKRDPRIRIVSIPNGGVANARNVGTELAKGEFVAYLDADDLWHPTKIEAQVESMAMRVNGVLPAASYTFMRFIDQDDRVTHSSRAVSLSGNAFARHLYFKPVGNGSSILVRREVAIRLGGYDPDWAAKGIGGCEDLDMELKIAAQYPITCVPLYLVGCREYPGNMSSNHLRMAVGSIATIESHVAANPGLPVWAARVARAAILDYASVMFMLARQRRKVLSSVSRLIWLRPSSAAAFVARNVNYRVRALVGVEARDAAPLKRRFYEVEPAKIDPVNTLSKQDALILERLAQVDLDARTLRSAPYARRRGDVISVRRPA